MTQTQSWEEWYWYLKKWYFYIHLKKEIDTSQYSETRFVKAFIFFHCRSSACQLNPFCNKNPLVHMKRCAWKFQLQFEREAGELLRAAAAARGPLWSNKLQRTEQRQLQKLPQTNTRIAGSVMCEKTTTLTTNEELEKQRYLHAIPCKQHPRAELNVSLNSVNYKLMRSCSRLSQLAFCFFPAYLQYCFWKMVKCAACVHFDLKDFSF